MISGNEVLGVLAVASIAHSEEQVVVDDQQPTAEVTFGPVVGPRGEQHLQIFEPVTGQHRLRDTGGGALAGDMGVTQIDDRARGIIVRNLVNGRLEKK